MNWRIKRYIRRIKNIFYWLPVIWRDEQWDYYYIYAVLKHKLTRTAHNIRKNGTHVSADYDANRIMLCVKLIDIVQNEYYYTKALESKTVTLEAVEQSHRQHNKAKRIMFKLLDNYIERWWD